MKLPALTLADGMTCGGQRQRIEAIADNRSTWDDLNRPPVDGALHPEDISQDDKDGIGHWGGRADLWFVAYGDSEKPRTATTSSTSSSRRPLKTRRTPLSVKLLGDADLKKRGLPSPLQGRRCLAT